MSKSNPSKRGRKVSRKAAKDHPDFPLYRHARGYWAKTIRGKKCYFGKIADDPNGEAALELYLAKKDALLAGRTPRDNRGGLTVRELVNRFLEWKESLVDCDELEPSTFRRYKATGTYLVGEVGKTRIVEDLYPEDFQRLRTKMAKKWGPVALCNEIQVIRSIFLFAHKNGLIDKPVQYGTAFDKPSAKTIRKSRAAKGLRMFEAAEIHTLLEHSTVNLKAMVFLAINGGLGNTDIGLLPISAVDLKRGWLDYPRAKTAIGRRIPLWPETVKALREALKARPEPNNPESKSLFFIGPRGEDYVGNHKGYRVTAEMDRATARAGLAGRTFYDLRRTFQTIGENAHDLVAVQSIMGHAPGSGDMSAIYRQRIDDARLKNVVECVASAGAFRLQVASNWGASESRPTMPTARSNSHNRPSTR